MHGQLRNIPRTFGPKILPFILMAHNLHKYNSNDEARSTTTMAWRRKSEGLNPLCTTKGKRAGTGGRMAHFMVALSPGRDIVLCHQYQGRLDGKLFASIARKLFPDVYKKTEHCEGRLFLQDECPVQDESQLLLLKS